MPDHPLQNCGWRFEFKCPKQWEALRETAEAGVRACGQCQQLVYLCRSESEMSQHVQAGHCIAAPAGVHRLSPVPVEKREEEPLDVGLYRPVDVSEVSQTLLRLMLNDARRAGAEQLRIEATEARLVVRRLQAGALREVHWPPLLVREPLLRLIQERSGASAEQPGLLEYRQGNVRAQYPVFFRHLERDVEVVIVMKPSADALDPSGRPVGLE